MRGLFCSLRVEPKEGRYVHEHEEPEDYDLLDVSMICLSENKDDADNDVLKMLNLLVDRKMDAETKVKRLETKLGLKLSDSGRVSAHPRQ